MNDLDMIGEGRPDRGQILNRAKDGVNRNAVAQGCQRRDDVVRAREARAQVTERQPVLDEQHMSAPGIGMTGAGLLESCRRGLRRSSGPWRRVNRALLRAIRREALVASDVPHS